LTEERTTASSLLLLGAENERSVRGVGLAAARRRKGKSRGTKLRVAVVA